MRSTPQRTTDFNLYTDDELRVMLSLAQPERIEQSGEVTRAVSGGLEEIATDIIAEFRRQLGPTWRGETADSFYKALESIALSMRGLSRLGFQGSDSMLAVSEALRIAQAEFPPPADFNRASYLEQIAAEEAGTELNGGNGTTDTTATSTGARPTTTAIMSDSMISGVGVAGTGMEIADAGEPVITGVDGSTAIGTPEVLSQNGDQYPVAGVEPLPGDYGYFTEQTQPEPAFQPETPPVRRLP